MKDIPSQYKRWDLTFDIKPFDIHVGKTNILNLGLEGAEKNKGRKMGNMNPSIWFHSGTTQLDIYASIGNNPKYHKYEISTKLI